MYILYVSISNDLLLIKYISTDNDKAWLHLQAMPRSSRCKCLDTHGGLIFGCP